MTKRRKKTQPSAPSDIAARRADADREAAVKEGPSTRILRQMLRDAHAPALIVPKPRFEWSLSQLTRLRRAEEKRDSGDRKTQANGVAEIARLMGERDTAIARVRREAHEVETLALAEGRGDVVEAPDSKPGEAAKPLIRRSGLDWLRRKGRISLDQHIAGLRYADDYRRATDVSLRSCLSSPDGGGDGLHGAEAREEAHGRLRAARIGALHSHSRMIELCNQVCGEGRTIRQLSGDSEAEAQHCEASLVIALDLLGIHYGTARKCELAMST